MIRPWRKGIASPLPVKHGEQLVAGLADQDGKKSGRSYIGCGALAETWPIHRRIVRFYGLALETGVLVVSSREEQPRPTSRLGQGRLDRRQFNSQHIASVHHLHKVFGRANKLM